VKVPVLALTSGRILRRWPDLLIVLGLVAALSGLTAAVRLGRAYPRPAVDLSAGALPYYATLSLGRMLAAYVLSVGFALAYARVAVSGRWTERVMLPLLDILQSVPILGFFPAVTLVATALFPGSRVGPELAAILLIFTSQAWNLAFAFYGALITIPEDLKEATAVLRLNGWLRFTRLELPFGIIALVFNSIMSWANGWFFLIAAEQFGLGTEAFWLPGLGAYLRAAADAGDVRALGLGLLTLVVVVLLVDQVLWRPLLNWADRFRYEETGGLRPPASPMLTVLRRSALVRQFSRLILTRLFGPVDAAINRLFIRLESRPRPAPRPGHRTPWLLVLGGLGLSLAVGLGLIRAAAHLLALSPADWAELLTGTGASLGRVALALAVTAAWTVPVGVGLGLRRELGSRVLPFIQVAASVPATAFFPAVLLLAVRLPAGIEVSALLLMALASQWYVLFNVVAGALAIPADLLEAAAIFQLRGFSRWRLLLVPGIFAHLVTGLITAAGAAWNATVVAEYISFGGEVYRTAGIGAFITARAEAGDTPGLLAGTLVMAGLVVAIDRVFWRRLYGWAESRFRVE